MDWFEANQRSHGFQPQPGYWETFARYRLSFPAAFDAPVAQLHGPGDDVCQNLPDLPGLVLGWVEAKFCNEIRNV